MGRFAERVKSRLPKPSVNGGPHNDYEAPMSWLVARRASALQSLPVDWLWQPRIARGVITLIDGDPGLGKSLLTIDLATRLTRGYAMPPGNGPSHEYGNVVMLSAEDDCQRVI